jgi:serine/threonine-protein kinase
MYDFDASRMWLCDLDEYRRGPFVVEADRLPGSLRFMAPEELRTGGVIAERTTLFNLGRAGLVLFDEGEVGTSFRGPSELAAIAVRASRDEPDDRYATVQDFVDEWRIAAAGVRA